MTELGEGQRLTFKMYRVEVEHIWLPQLALQAGQGFFDRMLVVAVEKVVHRFNG